MAEDDKIEETEPREPATPVCLCCLQPVDPVAHYCSNCGEAMGTFTTYLPFESIPWRTHIWGRMWRQIWSRNISIPGRLLRCLGRSGAADRSALSPADGIPGQATPAARYDTILRREHCALILSR